MYLFQAIAKRHMGYIIPRGFMLKVISNKEAGPDLEELYQALRYAGFIDIDIRDISLSNWIICKK